MPYQKVFFSSYEYDYPYYFYDPEKRISLDLELKDFAKCYSKYGLSIQVSRKMYMVSMK